LQALARLAGVPAGACRSSRAFLQELAGARGRR